MDIRKGGRFIKEKRLERAWGQSELVARCNASGKRISQQTLSRYESGRVQAPEFEHLLLIGYALGLTPNDMAEAFEVLPPKPST